eukprot:RCo030661
MALQPRVRWVEVEDHLDDAQEEPSVRNFLRSLRRTSAVVKHAQEERAQELRVQAQQLRLSPATILQCLSQEDLNELIREFQELEGKPSGLPGLLLEEFMQVLGPYVEQHFGEGVHHDLQEIFRMCDQNGDERVSFADFSGVVLDASLSHNCIRKDTEMPLGEWACAATFELHSGSEDVVRKMKFFPAMNRLWVSLRNRTCHVLDPTNGFSRCKGFDEAVPADSATVYDAEHIPTTQSVVTSSVDGVLRTYTSTALIWVLRREQSMESPQTVLRWNRHTSRLFSAGQDGHMLIWSPSGMRGCRELEQVIEHRLRSHSDTVSDMLFYGDGNHVATCAMDGSVAVRDLRRAEDVVTPLKGHEKGVYSLAHSDEYHLLFSAGFEFECLAWVDLSAGVRPLRLKDPQEPHAACLAGVQVIEGSPQVVTADVRGVVKVWDLRKMQSVSTFHIPPEVPRRELGAISGNLLHSFIALPNQQMLLHGPKKSYLFEYDFVQRTTAEAEATELPVAHFPPSIPMAGVLHNGRELIVSAAGQELKVWRASTGELDVWFKNIGDAEATVMVTDASSQRFILGTQGGLLFSFHFTGAMVGSLRKEGLSAVTAIAVSPQYIISTHARGIVVFWANPAPPAPTS